MKHAAPFVALSFTLFSADALAQQATPETPPASTTAEVPTSPPWMMSALGVAEDRTALAVGIVFVSPYPVLDLRVMHGLTPRIALDAHVSTLGFTQAARAGARMQVMQRENASLAIRAGVFEGHTTVDQGRVWIAAGPGAIASFGTSAVQVSASLDLGVMFHDTAARFGEGPGVTMRPAIGLEIPLDAGFALLVETGGLVFVTRDLEALPFFASGIAW